jgi:restriction endonuclease Mrr
VKAKPTCPHCQHELTLAEVGAINVALRTDRLLKGNKRRKPRVREVMPTLFNSMKDGKIHRSKNLFRHVTDTLAKQGFEPKRLATSFALTWLEREGLVEHVQRGFWRLTSEGKHLEEMTAELATEIACKHDPALSQRIFHGTSSQPA